MITELKRENDLIESALELVYQLRKIAERLKQECESENWEGQTLLENALRANIEIGKFLSVYGVRKE